MKLRKTLIVTLLFAAAGCSGPKTYPLQSKQATSGDWTLPYGEWSFYFQTPAGLPAQVSFARVIDTDGYLYTFNTLDGTGEDPDSIGKWANMRGGGLVHFNKVKKPPQYMVFCWDSLIDKKTYETSVVFSPETWQQMKTPVDQSDGGRHSDWYDYMVFGLAPEGKVRIGLPDTANSPTPLIKPINLQTRSGADLTLCKGKTRHPDGYDDIESIQNFIKGKTYPYGDWD